MKCLIVGSSGQMGSALVFAMSKLGYSVVEADIQGTEIYFNARLDSNHVLDIVHPDLVISALPYHLNLPVARAAIDKCIPYFDLGGHVGTSKSINKLAHEHKSMVGTDLGLAPGWINILAERAVQEMPEVPDTIEMYVGGIPCNENACGPLKYRPNWSISGLLNEYRDTCEVLISGQIVEREGMNGYKRINPAGISLESFYTSGGAAHTLESMQNRGVKHCCYRTLRWPGHHKMMQWLFQSTLTDDELAKLIISYGDYECANMVVLHVEAHKGHLHWVYDKTILDDEIVYEIGKNFSMHRYAGFTSMQKATAFPCAAAVDTFMGSRDTKFRYLFNNSKSYNDLDLTKFNKSLAVLDKSLVSDIME